ARRPPAPGSPAVRPLRRRSRPSLLAPPGSGRGRGCRRQPLQSLGWGMRGKGEGAAMDGQPVISVRGEASLEVEPEIAIMTVTIEARDRDRRTVLGRLASRNQHVTGLIKRHGEAVEKLESGPASVRPEIRDKKASERVAGYMGRASVRITVRDFTVLGELVASLSDEDLVT